MIICRLVLESSATKLRRFSQSGCLQNHSELIAQTLPHHLPGDDLSLPLQHCRETGGCRELTYLMAQECCLAASILSSILLASETSIAHPHFPLLSFTPISSFQWYNHPWLTICFASYTHAHTCHS